MKKILNESISALLPILFTALVATLWISILFSGCDKYAH